MDRDTLVTRNQRFAEALHQPTFRQLLRDRLLAQVARLPVFQHNADAKRLLIIRPDHFGDVLLTTPALQLIKRQRPDVSIHVLCGEWAADVLANYDEIELVLTLDFPGFQRQRDTLARNPFWVALDTAKMLRRIGYSSAIIMRPDHWWGAMVAFLAGIRERIGYDINNVSPFLTTQMCYQHQHVVKQNLRLAEAWLGIPEVDHIQLDFAVTVADNENIDRVFSDWQINSTMSIICIHPGSGAASKLWQSDKWALAADRVATQFSAEIVFTGSASERTLINEIVAKMREKSHIIAGETSVGQLAALYRRSQAVLGTDSGAMHMAAAVHTPTVTLFGPADPLEFAPWGDSRYHAVVSSAIGCRPCRILDWRNDKPEYHPCVREISVSQVLEETARVLQASSGAVQDGRQEE